MHPGYPTLGALAYQAFSLFVIHLKKVMHLFAYVTLFQKTTVKVNKYPAWKPALLSEKRGLVKIHPI